MKRMVLLLAVLLTASPAWAEIKTAVEHLDNTTATAGFHFKNLPAPSKDDAAAKAVVDRYPFPNVFVNGQEATANNYVRMLRHGAADGRDSCASPRETDCPSVVAIS